MEGLEISIINVSKLDLIQNRLDSDFYSKGNLFLESKINALNIKNIEAIGCKLDCSAFYPSITGSYSFGEGEVPFIRVNEIQEGLIQITDSTAFLPNDILEGNKNTIAIGYPNDIVIAKGGNTLAKVCILTDLFPKYALSRDVILIRTQDIPEKIIYGMWTFLHSKYGYKLMIRTASQTGQPHLTIPNILNLSIPMWKNDFLIRIEDCYTESVLLKNKSKWNYSEAENSLLISLGLTDINPAKISSTVKTFSDILISKRLDAEFYQPKYDEIELKIKQYKKGIIKLKEKFDIISTSSPSEYTKKGTKVIKTKNVRIPSVEYGTIEDLTDVECINIQKDDLLFASMGVGSLGRISYIDNYIENYTIDGTIKILRRKINVNSNIIIPTMLFLTSSIGQELIYRQVIGSTGIISINKNDIENLLMPNFDNEISNKVTQLVKESINLRAKSKRLLDLAKIAVEMAIEQGENEAMEYLTNNIN